jgi:hypothetical protein
MKIKYALSVAALVIVCSVPFRAGNIPVLPAPPPPPGSPVSSAPVKPSVTLYVELANFLRRLF